MIGSIKTHFLNSPVRSKLIIMLMLTALSASATLSFGFVLNNYNAEKKSLARELMLLGQIIAKRTAPTMEFVKTGNSDAVLKNLEDLAEKPSVILACVYFDGGDLLAKYTPGVAGDCPDAKTLPEHYGYSFKNGRLYTYQQIFANSRLEKTLGYLYMVSDLREMREHLRDVGLETAVLLLLVIIGVYIFALNIQNVISRPIMHLRSVAAKVREEKRYQIRAKKSYNDEIGSLVDTFNEMMEEVEQRDINLEDQVKERTAELENALQVKSDFLSNMSHEIRTPVHQITSFAKLLHEDWSESDEKERQGWVKHIFNSSGRLENLIQSLLDMAKLGRGGATLSLAKHNIRNMVDSSLEGMQQTIKESKVSVEIIDQTEGLELECDRTKIIQILTNLFTNGIRYGKGSPLVATMQKSNIKSEIRGEVAAWHFSLSDGGVGIPEGELEKIFEVNFMSSRTRSGAGGTGLGLSITRQLINLHGGKIWAENNPSQGSTFHFIIPLESDYGKAGKTDAA